MLQAIDCISATVHAKSDTDNQAGLSEFTAISPRQGQLADALAARSINHVPFDFHDNSGKRLSREVICDQLVQTIKHIGPDLVHANSLAMGRLTGAIAHQLTVPCCTHLRDIMKLSRAAISDINKNKMIIAVSQATQNFHVAQGLDAARTRVIHNAVDCNRFAPRAKTGSLAKELNLPPDSFIILTIGQIGLRKGQDVLAGAAPAIASNVPNAHFVIVGKRNSSKAESIAFEQNLSTQFSDAGLSDRIHLPGYRDDVDHLLNEADLLVHPAKQEPLGRVLLEAAASGLPIVATDVGGTNEILTHQQSATLIPPNNPASLSAAMIELASNPQLRQIYATTAREKMLAEFDTANTGSKLADAWRKLTSKNRLCTSD